MTGLADFFDAGGPGMYPILLWQMIAVGIILERGIFLYRSSINADVFVGTLQKCLLAGDLGRAIKVCSAANVPLANIVKAGLMKANRSDDQVQSAMDEAALREIPKLEKRTAYLGLMANMAMLSGLLGTVHGLILAFSGVAGADAASKSTILAAGISEAMACTAFGLFASILALLGFGILNGRTQNMLDDIHSASVTVVNLVVDNRTQMKLSAA
ncbi:MAG: MotA/TolQ/ExbB proton channel family protein [Myxococcales bacterium]|nr:MotA/TolQ/ExbB proton channel family protein [Myxococcales bacterium]